MIFHVATAADWRAAETTGAYRLSTRDRTLEDEGFIHCSYAIRSPGWPTLTTAAYMVSCSW